MCFVASILFIPRKIKPVYWRAFPVYLAILVVVETYCHYVSRSASVNRNNHAIYNGFFLVYACFHLWIFSKIILLKKAELLCACIALILLAGYAYEWNYQGFFFLFYRTITTFSGAVALLCIAYYFSLFKQESYHDLLKDASFWFVTGCLIFYTTNTAVNAFFAELVRIKIKGQISIRYVVMALLNVMMYGCWIKSFLCLKNKRIYIQA